MNDTKSIKIVFDNQTKRINEKINSYQDLHDKVKSLFELNDQNIRIYTFANPEIEIDICDNESLQEAFEAHPEVSCPKFFIEIAEHEKTTFEAFSIIPNTEVQMQDVSVSSQRDKRSDSIFEQESVREFIDKVMNNIIVKNEELSKEYFLNVQNVPGNVVEQYTRKTDIDLVKQYAKEFISKLFNRIKQKREVEESFLNIQEEQEHRICEENNLLEQIDDLMTSKLTQLEAKINNKLEAMVKEKQHNEAAVNYMGFSICAERKKSNDVIDEQNNIKLEDSSLEFVNIENSRKPLDFIFDDICSICSGNIYKNKFSCCICNNMILCEKCEDCHDHPLMKFKTREFASKDDILHYMLSNHDKKNLQVDKSLFKKMKDLSDDIFDIKYKLSINLFSYKLTARPNKKFKIPVIIANDSGKTIPKSKLIIISRNNKDLKVRPTTIETDISRKEKVEVYLECETNSQLKTYDFELSVFSANSKVICDPVNVIIDVNNDQEEEELNEYFIMYPKILGINKEEKKIIRNILQERISDKHPYILYNILIKYNWDTGLALSELTE
jgi:hypothetical protein